MEEDTPKTTEVTKRGLTVEQKREVWRCVCQEHKSTYATARELNIPVNQVKAVLQTRAFKDHLDYLFKMQRGRINLLRYDMTTEAENALKRMLERVENDERDVDGKPIIPAAAKNAIDFKLIDTAIPSKMEIDVRKITYEIPDPQVRNINRVLAELGDPEVIEAEVVDEPVPDPDPETPRKG